MSYADARREAVRSGVDLVVLVDVDDATRRRVAHAYGASAIVCTPTRDEVHKFGGAGVYVYRFHAATRQLYGGREATGGASSGPRCVGGRCGR